MPESLHTIGSKLALILKGLAMGAANKVPGVSGGVVAFVAGFYEEFIYSLQRFNLKAVKLLLNFRLISFWKYINGRFLSLLILGMLISYFSISKLLDYLILHFELYVWAAFFGMILGSLYVIAKDFNTWNIRTISLIILGIGVGVFISLLEPARENDNLLFVFFCGIIGVSGMTLPGLSGSFILILLGNYVLLLVDSVNALYDTAGEIFQGNFNFTEDPVRIRLINVLFFFSVGSLAGLISLSHLLGYVLKKYKAETFAVIIGFITGSLGVVWPWKYKIFKTDQNQNILIDAQGNYVLDNYNRYIPDFDLASTRWALLYIVTGILIVVGLEWYGDYRKKKLT
ncbi:DUF368 domain-containing protein [Aquimarina sp. ERC-38]|uniref:DUF368 domain-containing protein n=1 Tax=Aquimarina sp. ERC-38 TaxID=2949996 RepID=UPI0022453ADF|nr:DUF368 domain-containing protein [Aquimarina sp. ERC-38]UZO80463.1 DUF368 domain-containing protein [Aquimarina sp. ERC-38]